MARVAHDNASIAIDGEIIRVGEFAVAAASGAGDRLQHESRAHFQPHATITNSLHDVKHVPETSNGTSPGNMQLQFQRQ